MAEKKDSTFYLQKNPRMQNCTKNETRRFLSRKMRMKIDWLMICFLERGHYFFGFLSIKLSLRLECIKLQWRIFEKMQKVNRTKGAKRSREHGVKKAGNGIRWLCCLCAERINIIAVCLSWGKERKKAGSFSTRRDASESFFVSLAET